MPQNALHSNWLSLWGRFLAVSFVLKKRKTFYLLARKLGCQICGNLVYFRPLPVRARKISARGEHYLKQRNPQKSS